MKLRYFCDLCGTEVPKNTIRCPSCGRYFTAIQCPRCGFRGEEKDFAQGCPKCGYMKISRPSAASGSIKGTRAVRRSARSADRDRRKRSTAARAANSPAAQQPPPPAAVGVYRLIGILLAVILIVLIVILFLR